MSIESELNTRSESKCELCTATSDLKAYEVAPERTGSTEDYILACANCIEQMEGREKLNVNHWRCLSESMWSQVPAIQVMAWRLLHRLRSESWAVDLLDILYLDEETLRWAKATGEDEVKDDAIKHVDSNGAELHTGDTVVLIKTLNVKGSSFSAKRGTAVKKISLVHDNPEHIEGRVNGQQIVILTKYVKKQS